MKIEVEVVAVEWFDKDGQEASVTFKIGETTLAGFSHPCDLFPGYIGKVEIDYLVVDVQVETMFRNAKKGHKGISSRSKKWAYDVEGEVRSISPFLIDCGSLLFEANIWTNDMSLVGEFISLPIDRLDIMRA